MITYLAYEDKLIIQDIYILRYCYDHTIIYNNNACIGIVDLNPKDILFVDHNENSFLVKTHTSTTYIGIRERMRTDSLLENIELYHEPVGLYTKSARKV